MIDVIVANRVFWSDDPPISNDPLDDMVFDKYGIPIMPSVEKKSKKSRVKRAIPFGGIDLLAVDPLKEK